MKAVDWFDATCATVLLAVCGFVVWVLLGGRLGPPEPRVPYTCPREAAGGYELVSVKKDPVQGDEYDCHYVKRGVK